VLTSGGDFGWNAVSTVRSLVHFAATGSVRLHIVGDTAGIEALKAAMQQSLPALGPRGEAALRDASFYNAFASREFADRLNTMPFGCIWRHTFGQITWARFLYPDLLPAEVQRVVVMCVGDVAVLGDAPKELAPLFNQFEEGQYIGMWNRRGADATDATTGVVLLDLEKLRKSDFITEFVDAAVEGLRRGPDRFCMLVEKDVMLKYMEIFPGRVRIVNGAPGWHYFPTRPWAAPWRQEYIPPGALGPWRYRHYCPTLLERAVWMLLAPRFQGGPNSLEEVRRLLDVAILHHKQSLDDPENHDFCGGEIKLLHFPGRLKQLRFAGWILRWWAVAGLNASNWTDAAFRTSKGDVAAVAEIGASAVAGAKQLLNKDAHASFVSGVAGGF